MYVCLNVCMYSRLEIEDLLMEFDLSFSQKKMRQIFHQIDRNFDDSVSRYLLVVVM